MSPRVSVVIPAHNAEQLISLAIESALGQTMADLEVIVVDDGSSDGTAEVVARHAAADRRLRLLRMPANGGPAAARNRAISAATGEWIAPLDADDAFEPNRLDVLLGLAGPAEMVADLMRLTSFPDLAPLGEAPPADSLPLGGEIDAVTFVAANDFLHRGFTLGYLKPIIRRDFLDRHAIRYREDLRICEDYHFYLDCLLAGARWHVVPLALYDYVQRPGSLSRRIDDDRFAAILRHSAATLELPGLPEPLRAAIRARHHGIERARRHAAFMDALRQGALMPAMRLAAGDPWLIGRTAGGAAHRLAGKWGRIAGNEHRSV